MYIYLCWDGSVVDEHLTCFGDVPGPSLTNDITDWSLTHRKDST